MFNYNPIVEKRQDYERIKPYLSEQAKKNWEAEYRDENKSLEQKFKDIAKEPTSKLGEVMFK